MPSLLSKSLQAVGVTTFFSVTAFTVWTKHSHFTNPQKFNPSTDPLFTSEWARKYNPRGNDATYDECVRRIGLVKIRGDLIEDARAGGSKLVEEFVRGIWGGPGYTIQRLYLTRKYRSPATTAPTHLWTTPQLRSSAYPPGTQITDHFVVLSKSPTSILVRCGDSPARNPDSPRDSDGLFEMTAVANLDEGYAEFRLKSVFYSGGEGWKGGRGMLEDGAGEVETWENRGPMQGTMWYAHKLYTKLWMESALSRCKA